MECPTLCKKAQRMGHPGVDFKNPTSRAKGAGTRVKMARVNFKSPTLSPQKDAETRMGHPVG